MAAASASTLSHRPARSYEYLGGRDLQAQPGRAASLGHGRRHVRLVELQGAVAGVDAVLVVNAASCMTCEWRRRRGWPRSATRWVTGRAIRRTGPAVAGKRHVGDDLVRPRPQLGRVGRHAEGPVLHPGIDPRLDREDDDLVGRAEEVDDFATLGPAPRRRSTSGTPGAAPCAPWRGRSSGPDAGSSRCHDDVGIGGCARGSRPGARSSRGRCRPADRWAGGSSRRCGGPGP